MARLHADAGFLEKIGKEFTGDVVVRFHLAPPLLAAKPDARGRAKKRSFGSWILPAFKVLSRMKRLRGTAFDPFGYTSHRRPERSLIPWFEEIVDALLKNLSVESLPAAIEDVRQIMEIRGYGPVKEVAIERVKKGRSKEGVSMRARQAACGIDREYRVAGGEAAGLLTGRHRQFSEATSVRGYRFSISANFRREPRHPHWVYRHLRKNAPQRATIVDRACSACCDTGVQDFRHDTDGCRIRCCCFPC